MLVNEYTFKSVSLNTQIYMYGQTFYFQENKNTPQMTHTNIGTNIHVQLFSKSIVF